MLCTVLQSHDQSSVHTRTVLPVDIRRSCYYVIPAEVTVLVAITMARWVFFVGSMLLHHTW
jgi:hypothetical protein